MILDDSKKFSVLAESLLFIFLTGLFFTLILLQAATAGFLVLGIYLFLSRKFSNIRRFDLLLLGYAVSAMVSFLITQPAMEKLPQFLPMLVILTYFPVFYFFKRADVTRFDHWLNWIVMFATLAAVVGWIYYFMGKDRTTTTFGGYFTLASLMAWSIPITAGKFLSMISRKSYLYAISLYLQLMALWWTFTRSAFLALMAAIGCWLLVRLFKTYRDKSGFTGINWSKWGILISLPLLLIILILVFGDWRVNPLGSQASMIQEEVDLSSGRIIIFQDAKRILSQDLEDGDYVKLLLGHGLASRRSLIPESFFGCWESDYLEIFMNQGLLGLILLIPIYIYFIRVIWRGFVQYRPEISGIAAAGLAIFVMSFLTLKFTSWHSGAMFILTIAFMESAIGNKTEA